MQSLPAPLASLANYNQFILYNADKQPINPHTGRKFPKAEAGAAEWITDSSKWTSAADALAAVKKRPELGVGFVLTSSDPFWCCDLDGCRQGDGWSPLARQILDALPGCAVEVSRSGNGLHLFGCGTPPPHACRNTKLHAEFYSELRYIALTGREATGDAWQDFSQYLPPFVGRYFPPRETVGDFAGWTDTPCDEWGGYEDDDELIKKALASTSARAAFGGAASFAQLWNADGALADVYPPDKDGSVYNESVADAALAQHLAFWTGKNCERMRQLMEKSALRREKWDRVDYLPLTIRNACSQQKDVHRKTLPPLETVPDVIRDVESGDIKTPQAEIVSGFQYLAAQQQIELFKNHVYVQELHRVLAPHGAELKEAQFNATYGGFLFQLDDQGKTTKTPWEAFTASQVVRYDKAHKVAFRPDLPSMGLFESGGLTYVNAYVPHVPVVEPGDVGPFLGHLAKLLPVRSDREIFLAYLAAIVQHKGVKFTWAPLLQGIEGNGKTFFTFCVKYCIGDEHTHLPRADEIGEKFNSWLFKNLFIGVEDIYISEQKRELAEILKPMITGERQAIRAMQTDQITREICCNFIFNSNHKDAVRKTENDRRFAVFYTAQQEPADLVRDGLGGDYFPQLYRWAKNGGFAAVAHYLQNYEIPAELNPAEGCTRAPVTSSTAEAIESSRGSAEQEILEAIAQGRPGFAGGWVSSIALDRLLTDVRKNHQIPIRKRREIMRSLGYDRHPGLKDGRTHNKTTLDGNKPVLYVKTDSILCGLRGGAEIAKKYEADQLAGGGMDAEKAFGKGAA